MSDVKYDPALCERLVREARESHAVTQREEPSCGCMDRNFSEVFGTHPDADCPAKIHRNAVVDAWMWNEVNLSALADQLEAARAEIDRLTGCMEIAGLQCFMRGGAPEQVAEHMRRVVSSWMEKESKLTGESDALQAKLDAAATIEAASQRTIATWEAAFVEWGKERERLTHRHTADLARWRQRNAEQAAGEARERDRMRPVVEAAESEVDQRGPLQPYERLRDPLCVAVDAYRAARDGEK